MGLFFKTPAEIEYAEKRKKFIENTRNETMLGYVKYLIKANPKELHKSKHRKALMIAKIQEIRNKAQSS